MMLAGTTQVVILVPLFFFCYCMYEWETDEANQVTYLEPWAPLPAVAALAVIPPLTLAPYWHCCHPLSQHMPAIHTAEHALHDLWAQVPILPNEGEELPCNLKGPRLLREANFLSSLEHKLSAAGAVAA